MLAKLQTFSLLGIEAVPVEVEVDVSLLKTDAWDGPPYFFGVYEMGDVAMRMWGVDVWERWGLSLLLNREEMVDTEAVEPIVREV